MHSETHIHAHAHKNPSEEYFINTSNNSKEFGNISILLLYYLCTLLVLAQCLPKQSRMHHLFINPHLIYLLILLDCSITQVPALVFIITLSNIKLINSNYIS